MSVWLIALIVVVGFLALVGGIIAALQLGLIVTKAVQPPDRGESTDYRLEQGREVNTRSRR